MKRHPWRALDNAPVYFWPYALTRTKPVSCFMTWPYLKISWTKQHGVLVQSGSVCNWSSFVINRKSDMAVPCTE